MMKLLPAFMALAWCVPSAGWPRAAAQPAELACLRTLHSTLHVALAEELALTMRIGRQSFDVGSFSIPSPGDVTSSTSKVGKLEVPVDDAVAEAAATLSHEAGHTAPVTLLARHASGHMLTTSLQLCELVDNAFRFRLRLHAASTYHTLPAAMDTDLPAKYAGCSPGQVQPDGSTAPLVYTSGEVLQQVPSGNGMVVGVLFTPTLSEGVPADTLSRAAPYPGQAKIAAREDGSAHVDAGTGEAAREKEPPSFWSKYGMYIMIGVAVMMLSGGGGDEGQGGGNGGGGGGGGGGGR